MNEPPLYHRVFHSHQTNKHMHTHTNNPGCMCAPVELSTVTYCVGNSPRAQMSGGGGGCSRDEADSKVNVI